MSLSTQRKGTWFLDDAYKRIGADCWRYAGLDSGAAYLYAMGRGSEGQFGNNRTDITNRGYPQELPGNDWGCLCGSGNYRAIIARKSDGSWWSLGNNDYGKLGDPSGAYKSSPMQIAGCWCTISSAHQNSLGVKCDGTLWTWGYGNHGQRGLSTPTCNYTNESCNSMCQIGSATDWLCAFSSYHGAYGIKTNNTAFAWGYSGHGETGLSNTCCYSSPVQLPGSWCEIRGQYPVIGKRTDGTWWTWGHNNHGQLGNSTTTNYSSPIALPGAWIHLAADHHSSQMMAGIKNDNTLWTWGYNGHGGLGTCDTNPRCSPVQVPGSWKYVATGHRHTIAVKTDGTLWGWGHNTGEQRFSCHATDFSSPIQLPGTNWMDVAASYEGTWARKCGTSIAND